MSEALSSYIIKQDIRIHIYIAYSRPNGWTDMADFFLWTRMGVIGLKNRKYFFKIFYSLATLDPPASII